MKLAIVNNNIVTSVVVTTEVDYNKFTVGCQAAVDVTDTVPCPDIGWKMVGNALVPPAGYAALSTKITKLALRQRLTFGELCALEAASKTDVQVAVLKDNLMVASFVDLKRPDTAAAIGLLTAKQLLTPARAAVILNTPPNEYEVYRE